MKTLRNIFLSVLFVFAISLNAQNENVDVIEIETTKKAMFENDQGELVEKKVKIIERRTQEVATKPNEHHMLNQTRLNTPVKVVKTILIDSDNDKLYDTTTVVEYLVKNDTVINLGLKTTRGSGEVSKEMREIDDERMKVYVLGTDDTAIFGYINNDNEFVVEAF